MGNPIMADAETASNAMKQLQIDFQTYLKYRLDKMRVESYMETVEEMRLLVHKMVIQIELMALECILLQQYPQPRHLFLEQFENAFNAIRRP